MMNYESIEDSVPFYCLMCRYYLLEAKTLLLLDVLFLTMSSLEWKQQLLKRLCLTRNCISRWLKERIIDDSNVSFKKRIYYDFLFICELSVAVLITIVVLNVLFQCIIFLRYYYCWFLDFQF